VRVAVSVDPRWTDQNSDIDALITCFSLDAGPVDWDGLRINIAQREGERSITWLAFLNAKGQAIRRLPAYGEYSVSLPHHARSEVFAQAIHPPIRARGSVELTHEQTDAALCRPFEKDGEAAGGTLSWRIEEIDGNVRLSVRAADEKIIGKRIEFSMVESAIGRVQVSGDAIVSGIRGPYNWVSLGRFAEVSAACDLVFELPCLALQDEA
jgi:hypothetical protein